MCVNHSWNLAASKTCCSRFGEDQQLLLSVSDNSCPTIRYSEHHWDYAILLLARQEAGWNTCSFNSRKMPWLPMFHFRRAPNSPSQGPKVVWVSGLLCYFRPDEEQGQLWRKARDGWIEKAPDDSSDAPTAPGPRWRSVFGAPPSPGALVQPSKSWWLYLCVYIITIIYIIYTYICICSFLNTILTYFGILWPRPCQSAIFGANPATLWFRSSKHQVFFVGKRRSNMEQP